MASDSLTARFWQRVDRSGGIGACWPFQGARDGCGYGRLSRAYYGESLAHRFAAVCAGFPPCEAVMHECDNPPCCNPLHLTPADRAANNRQAWARGLHPRGEAHHMCRLSDADVAAVRARVLAGERQVALAREFGVVPSHVSKIVSGDRRVA